MLPVIARAASVTILLAAAAACSSGATTSPPPVPTAAPASGADRAAIEQVFGDYDNALLARDFTTACSLTAPQASTALIKSVAAQGSRVTTCEQAFTALYAIPEARGSLDADARTSKINNVTVAGDTATVTYSGNENGQSQKALTNKLQRIDGHWLMVGDS